MKTILFTAVLAFCFTQKLIGQSLLELQHEIKEGTITNLYDAFGKNENLTQDFGFSCIINYRGKIICSTLGAIASPKQSYLFVGLGETIGFEKPLGASLYSKAIDFC